MPTDAPTTPVEMIATARMQNLGNVWRTIVRDANGQVWWKLENGEFQHPVVWRKGDPR